MEVAGQLLRGRVTDVSAHSGGHIIREEKLDGHQIVSAPLHKRSFAQQGRDDRPVRRCAMHKGIAKYN